MGERIGREQLLAMTLAGTPARLIELAVAPSPEDAADLTEIRDSLALLAMDARPVAPSAGLRARLLATRPRPRRPKRPVVLVLDMINDHLTEGMALEVPRARAIVPALKQRLAAARAQGTPVVYVCDRHESVEDTDFDDWPLHALEGTPGAEVWPELAPEPGDRLITKPTYSAFSRSKLAPLLDELGADELVLTGCATEVGIQATATDALQRGYVVSIPADSQAGLSPETEGVTMAMIGLMPPYDPIYLRDRR